jgi:hypothetical protein
VVDRQTRATPPAEADAAADPASEDHGDGMCAAPPPASSKPYSEPAQPMSRKPTALVRAMPSAR